ncbi:hypothetical protein D3C80_1637790 [compost metagenome]
MHGRQQRLDEVKVAFLRAGKPDLAAHAVEPVPLEDRAIFAEHVIGEVDRRCRYGVEERHQRFGEPRQVPLADRRLAGIGVAPKLVDRGKHLLRIIGVHEGARAEVDRLA